jgi:hypothetical protein
MEEAFGRLTKVQQHNINKYMFEIAYKCVAKSGSQPDILVQIVKETTLNHPNLEKDLLRYCKLADSVK